ncbi:hypothetical protein M0R72_02780 [Candidatus Pacearchaeota archaeon]|jgi:hypothetical protein|nr:hypothetical protein [Candidatus Pacearchaeota archaeon]
MRQERLIASARAALNCPFDLLVDMLGLEPVEDWHVWRDFDGNRLRLLKNGVVKVYPATAISTKTTDVFRKANPALIERHSYWGMLLSGQNNILILLGNDGKIRSSYFENNIWVRNISPLLLGFGILRYISSGYLETNLRTIKFLKVSYPNDFIIEEAWAFGLPIEQANIKERVDILIAKYTGTTE